MCWGKGEKLVRKWGRKAEKEGEGGRIIKGLMTTLEDSKREESILGCEKRVE
jgi:hypothetical protein